MKNIPKEVVEGTANAIMANFIPKDKNATEFSFYFTIPITNNFKASYKKEGAEKWKLVDVETVVGS